MGAHGPQFYADKTIPYLHVLDRGAPLFRDHLSYLDQRLVVERLSLASSWRRRERRLTWIELHVESGEKRRCPGIIAHEGGEINQSAAAELP